MTYMTRQQQAVLDCIAACPGGCATAMALADRLQRRPVRGTDPPYTASWSGWRSRAGPQAGNDEGACWQYCDCHAHRDWQSY